MKRNPDGWWDEEPARQNGHDRLPEHQVLPTKGAKCRAGQINWKKSSPRLNTCQYPLVRKNLPGTMWSKTVRGPPNFDYAKGWSFFEDVVSDNAAG